MEDKQELKELNWAILAQRIVINEKSLQLLIDPEPPTLNDILQMLICNYGKDNVENHLRQLENSSYAE